MSHLVYLLHLIPCDENWGQSNYVVLEVTPESVDETLLHEVVYIFSELDHHLDHSRLRCLVWSKVRNQFGIEVRPVQAAHSLDAVWEVIRGCDIEVPLEAFGDKVPFHFYEFLITIFIPNESLNVLNGWLVHILFIDFTGQKYTW